MDQPTFCHAVMTPEDFSKYRVFVESLFSSTWLAQSAPHRLRTVWRRTDKLAKVEIASLGFFIKQLEPEHKRWLADTVQDVKDQDQSPHGPLFEIVTLGSLAARGMNVRPMKKHFPGYDAVVSDRDGYNLRVSIKNHDISTHEKQFRFESARLANIVRRRVLASAAGWQAVIRSRTHLDTSAFEEIARVLRATPIRSGELAPGLFPKRGASIQMRKLSDSKFLPGSYTCNVMCPQTAYEQARFRKNINIAIKKFDEHSPRSPEYSNVIFMRLHGSADVEEVRRYANEAIAKEGCSVDAILLYQAVVGYDNITQGITYYATHVVSARYKGPSLKFPLQFLSGAVVSKPLGRELVIASSEEVTHVDDIASEYSYQRGELRYRVQEGRTAFEFPDPIPGIKQKLSFRHHDGIVQFSQPCIEDEDLVLL
ncbi:hypothetical protein [Massilia sp. Root1485]|nr:hypothetical protein [Massilia sp. Root1485]